VVHGPRGFTPIKNGRPVSISTKETIMGNINRCFGSGGPSARYQQDEHAQGSATPRSPQERDPYDPIALNDPTFAGLTTRRVSRVPVAQRGVATNEAGLQRERIRAEELQSQIATQVEQGCTVLQPILTRLDGIISNINAKLDGRRRGGSGPDEYRHQIEEVRQDFNACNSVGIDSSRHFEHSGQLENYNPYNRD
jgi:hypothetical protein